MLALLELLFDRGELRIDYREIIDNDIALRFQMLANLAFTFLF